MPAFRARPYLTDVGPRPEEEEDGARVSLEAGDVEGCVPVRVVGVVDVLPSLLHQEADDANVTLLKLAMTHVKLTFLCLDEEIIVCGPFSSSTIGKCLSCSQSTVEVNHMKWAINHYAVVLLFCWISLLTGGIT